MKTIIVILKEMKMSSEDRIAEFKRLWDDKYSYISMELEDYEIIDFLERYRSIERAVDGATDYLLSQGLADVQE